MRWKFVVLGAVAAAISLAGWAAIAHAQPTPATIPGVPVSPSGGLIPPPPPPGAVPPAIPAPPESGPATINPVPGSNPSLIPPSKSDKTPAEIPGSEIGDSKPAVPAVPSVPPGATITPPPATGTIPAPPTGTGAPAASGGAGDSRAMTDAKPVEPAVSVENPTGRQEPAVSIEWGGAPVAKVGHSGDYTLVVRNVTNMPVQSVIVRVRMPNGLSVEGTEPRASTEAGLLTWDLGTLTARQERVVNLKIKAESKGDLTPIAWVTFTGACAMKLRVREPKLIVKVQSPEKILVGDAAQFTLMVSNPGDGSADSVKIHAQLSEGLEHARGNKIDFEIGSLAAGESRNVTLLCATRVGGAQKVEVTAVADGTLKAQDACAVNVIMPRLDLQLVGPRLRYLDRKAVYTLKVTNPGDAPATNVTVADVVPAGFKVLAASHGGRHDSQTRTVSWFLGEVGPGQTREVQMEVQAITSGVHAHKATAVGARGLRAESELVTRVEGVAALLVELVDTEDPVEAGGETSYEVRITNTGSKTETDIKLVATVPDGMQFKNCQGPVRYREEGKTIVFETLDKLAPRADAIFRINCKAVDVGTMRFKIQVNSANLTEGVVKQESTRIYADSPEQGTSPEKK